MSRSVEEQRKYKRYKAKDGTIAFLENGSTRSGLVKDVSRGGIAVRYIWDGDLPHDPVTVSIYSTGEFLFRMEKIRCRIVHDRDEFSSGGTMEYDGIGARVCGVQFEKLSFQDLLRLKYFLETCTLEEL